MNKRRVQRKSVSDTSVEIFDGSSQIAGVVNNVSTTGIETCLESAALSSNSAKYELRLACNGKTYRVSAIPRWHKCEGTQSRIGLRICEAPRDWSYFVQAFPAAAPKNDEFDY